MRSKIREALGDMPQIDEVKNLLQNKSKVDFYIFSTILHELIAFIFAVFDYYICLRIIQILSDTHKESANFFGQYTCKRFQDWNQIVKDYEKNNLFLA